MGEDHSERIVHDGRLLAQIVRAEFKASGAHFFTSGELSQQLGYMSHPAGKLIPPHVHNEVIREVRQTQEVLLLRRGKLRVDFYDAQRVYLESRILVAGDLLLLIEGGHGFEVLEEIEMFEVKQGPYAGDADKTRFEGVAPDEVRIRE